MIISSKHKFIYIAVPKTGTTSVQHHISAMKLDEVEVYDMGNEVELPTGVRFRKHIAAADLKKKLYGFEQYFKFTFIRNPYCYAVSWVYYYFQRILKCSNLEDYSFGDMIKKCPQWVWKNQSEFIYEGDINLMDFVGKLENFQEDFNIICDKIKIPRQKLPHKNKTNHKHYTEYYDEETKQIVAEKYAKDIEYFGYEFGE